jgi:hypothetical protein
MDVRTDRYGSLYVITQYLTFTECIGSWCDEVKPIFGSSTEYLHSYTPCLISPESLHYNASGAPTFLVFLYCFNENCIETTLKTHTAIKGMLLS